MSNGTNLGCAFEISGGGGTGNIVSSWDSASSRDFDFIVYDTACMTALFITRKHSNDWRVHVQCTRPVFYGKSGHKIDNLSV